MQFSVSFGVSEFVLEATRASRKRSDRIRRALSHLTFSTGKHGITVRDVRQMFLQVIIRFTHFLVIRVPPSGKQNSLSPFTGVNFGLEISNFGFVAHPSRVRQLKR
jgi:hypothetical protein